jgi:hypothetical protein
LIGDYVGTPISWNNLNSWMIQLDASSATSPGPFCFHAFVTSSICSSENTTASISIFHPHHLVSRPPTEINGHMTQKAVRDTERETKVRSLQGATALGGRPSLGGVGPSQRFRSGSYPPVSMRRKSPINGGFNGEHI